MLASINLKWTGEMSFEGEVDGHKIPLDVGVDSGGKDSGARPKKLMLLALAGCTGMDVISLLKKMHVEVDEFSVDVEAEQTEAEHPHVYLWFKVIYKFKGIGLEKQTEKIKKAISLSQDKYCGVSAMMGKIGAVTYEIVIN